MALGEGAAVPRHEGFIEGALLQLLHRGTFTNKNSMNKHDLSRFCENREVPLPWPSLISQ